MENNFAHIGLFEGIGGFSLAARWAGWETKAWCEWNEFGQKVLKHHFPEAEGYGDIRKTDFTKYANKIDIITGGFPCQPYSMAGKRKGKDDERHLWPEMLRAIREVSPKWVVGENVRGLTNWNGGVVFDEVQADLEAQGYEVLPFLLPAVAVNAPHRRDRIWFIAYAGCTGGVQFGDWRTLFNGNRNVTVKEQGRFEQSVGIEGSVGKYDASDTRLFGQEECKKQTTRIEQCDKDNVTNSEKQRFQERDAKPLWDGTHSTVKRHDSVSCWQDFPTQPPICGGNDGIPRELDGITFPKWRNESLKAYGNAIVPQVAYEIFKAINAYRSLK